MSFDRGSDELQSATHMTSAGAILPAAAIGVPAARAGPDGRAARRFARSRSALAHI